MKKRSILAALALGCVTAFSTVAGAADQTFVTIGTGSVTGVYYPTGGAIARLVNKSQKDHGYRVNVEATGGSVYNINTIDAGELDFGVAQSDVIYQAYNGTQKFAEKGENHKIRSVFSVHPELYTVVARKDANIKNYEDIKGKRFNIGNPGSGQESTTRVLWDKLGYSEDDFQLISQLKAAEQAKALCDNKVDAIVFFAGHPNGSIKEATTACEANLVNVAGPVVEKLAAEKSYYRMAEVPGGMYRGNPDPATTIGVSATIVSSTDVPDDVVYTVVKTVFENLDTFKKLHPAFANLKKEQMVRDGLGAPLHPGAMKYYKEVGLL